MAKFCCNSSFILILFFFCSNTYAQASKNLYLDLNFDKAKTVGLADTIKITAEEFYLSYEFGPAFVKKSNNSREKHLEYMMNEKLLALDGYSRKLDTSEEVSSLLNDFEDDIASEELFKDSILTKVELDEQELKDIINKKQITIEIRWLFSDNENNIQRMYSEIVNGSSFDSLFLLQINDTTTLEDRSLKTNIYQLEKKNPSLAGLIHNLKINEVSSPIQQEDGWYVIKIDNMEKNLMTSEAEYQRLNQEAVNALTKKEMDILSDKFVDELMKRNNPVIKRDAFKIVRSYLGKYYLPKDKFDQWQLNEKLDEVLNSFTGDVDTLPLITLEYENISIKQFLNWYRNRSQYIRLNENSFADFSISLEKLVWRMVRDNLLSDLTRKYNYDKNPNVLKQISWWKDKIVSSAVRNEIANSIGLEVSENNTSGSKSISTEEMKSEFQKRMLHKILSLKQKYQVKLFKEELNKVPLSIENDRRAIEMYTVKSGGLIPRTPYPTINQEWVNWE